MPIDDKPRAGRSFMSRSVENFEKNRKIILVDQRRTIEEVEELSSNINGRSGDEKGGC